MLQIKKLFIITTFVFFTVLAGNAQTSQNQSKDEAAIRTNVEQMARGWKMKSGAEFAEPFAEDSDYVVVNGMHIKGRAANAEAHQRIFDTIYKDSSIIPIVRQIRFLRPDIAIVHAESDLSFKINGEEKKAKGMITMVMTKEKGKWRIAAFQNTPVADPNAK